MVGIGTGIFCPNSNFLSKTFNFMTNVHKPFITILTLFLMVISSNNLFAQGDVPYKRDYSPKSPEASSFGKYGEYSVSLFTGSPSISVPLPVSDEIPLHLSYNSSGHKPEELPGWVGLGWNLTAGGMITRIMRGNYDELSAVNLDGNPLGYFDNNFRLNGNPSDDNRNTLDWDDKIIDKVSCAPDIGFVPCVGVGDTANRNLGSSELEPDEFVFNFAGHSGSFMKNHLNQWIFRSNNGNALYKLKGDAPKFATFPNWLDDFRNYGVSGTNPKVIIGFTIITGDGTEYEFGGDVNSTEVTCNYPVSPFEHIRQYESYSTGWHLTKITTPSNKVTTFKYTKSGFYFVGNISHNRGYSAYKVDAGVFSFPYTSQQNGSRVFGYHIVEPCYLSEVESPYEKITFTKIRTNSEGITDIKDHLEILALQPDDVNRQGLVQVLYPQKLFRLKEIKSFAKGAGNALELKTHVQLDYSKSPSGRLRLDKVRRVNTITPTQSLDIAAFEYNESVILPNYGSNKTDSWGYYNNRGVATVLSYPSAWDENAYKVACTPDPAFMKAEIIKKIKYPTGGYTEFEFEPHNYSKSVVKPAFTDIRTNNTALDVADETTNPIAGGLRIKKIKNYDGNVETFKEYAYVKDYVTIVRAFLEEDKMNPS
jgi:hypothetical protein